jgi:hypothetical protein
MLKSAKKGVVVYIRMWELDEDGWCLIELEECACDKMGKRRFGQTGTVICHGGSYG